MPNYVYYKGTIDGTNEDIAHFMDQCFTDGDLDFQKLIPMPVALEGTRSPRENPAPDLVELYGADNWYDWKVENWGCKWNAGETEITVIDNEHSISFETAWSPAMPIFDIIAERFPDISINLQVMEEGGFFYGTIDIQHGTVIDGLKDAANDSEGWRAMAIEYFGEDPEEFDDE